MRSQDRNRSEPSKQSDDEEEKTFAENFTMFDGPDAISPYRFRKDVCYKFILRKFRNYYRDEFILLTGYTRDNKNKEARKDQLKK